MAGNIRADNNGDIFVEFDYNNIIVVDPNKTIDSFGKINERLVDHESLVMYANLEAELLPRTKLAVGGSPEDRIRTVSVAKINFLKPTKEKYLSTGYYDELSGENTTKYKGENQMQQRFIPPQNGSTAYVINEPSDLNNIIDNGLLGITQILITTSTSFIPTVKIELEDVQGRALFQLGNNSPYAAFFNLPYPIFYLTLKGFYGQAVKYQLNLEKFNARFNTFSGNYQVSLEFRGYKFNILREISMGHLLATPHMYSARFDVKTEPIQSQATTNNASSSTQNGISQPQDLPNVNSEGISEIISKKGYQKIVEVYSEYKAKGLIPIDFPELTLVQLMNKLESFEKNIADSFPKSEVESLTNIRTYKETLKDYFNLVRGSNNSWFVKYLNPRPIVLINGDRVYGYRSELDLAAKEESIPELKNIIDKYNQSLAQNPTLGVKGPSNITNPIKSNTIILETLNLNEINWKETTKQQIGVIEPTATQESEFKSKFIKNLKTLYEITSENQIKIIKPSYFIFDGNGRFDKQMALTETDVNKKLSEYETAITNKLLEKIEDKATGIGFKPTVRNIIAVILASSEGFIRLLDEVHTNAWNVKYDPIRKRAILDNPSSAPSSDSIETLKTAPFGALSSVYNYLNPVYPWPQFFVETPDDKKGRFQLTYIADPSIVDLTQGYLYDKWPEVEFVEEYLVGLTQKFDPPQEALPLGNERDTDRININAIEFPNLGLSYLNKEEIKFFYEIWERQFVTARYSNLIRANTNQINDLIKLNVEAEVNNIVKALGTSSPFLTVKLKNYKIDYNNYDNFLKNISNAGTGRAYQDFIRDFFVTPYIKNFTENSFGILNSLDLGKIPQSTAKSEALESLLVNASNQPLIIDTLPFTNQNWVQNNLSDANKSLGFSVYNTNKTLKIFEQRKIIANFTDTYEFKINRPITNFSYLNNNNPFKPSNDLTQNQINLNDFYLNRTPNNFIPTEGYCYFNTPTNQQEYKTTTSILNTPYFVNAILNDVKNSRTDDPYPYIQSAYLFLNSLPLATLRERYKSLNNNVTEDLDYIASCFKKFAAIHKLPYAWILKLGSNWHRYKKYKQTNVDILKSCWGNFDYISNYSPKLSSVTQTYSFKYQTIDENIILQNETDDEIKMNVGFYPKVINDFNYFYTGYDLFVNYDNKEIQRAVDLGMKIQNFKDSNIIANQDTKKLNLKTWSVLLPRLGYNSGNVCDTKDNTKGSEYFVVPSFGSPINQTTYSCFVGENTLVPVTSNSSVYNGTVRTLWSAPNYGYFDNGQISYPQPDSYVNYIDSNVSSQSPFSILNTNTYSKIEEIFSVFEKRILDSFEDEFLKFCKIGTNAEIEIEQSQFLQSNVKLNANFKNFQTFFKSLMLVPSKAANDSDENYFNNIINEQYDVFTNGIKSFLEYDIIFKYGNPSNYKRRIWDSYLSHLSTPQVVDPIIFETYILNSLPSENGGITLSQSKINNPQAWLALELEVGFSTIDGVNYTSLGSYITNFFIENNIQFTSENVTLLSSIIKMWATEKLSNPQITVVQFKDKLLEFLQNETDLQDVFLNQVLDGVQRRLPNQQQIERTVKTAIQGQQGKVQLYEVFKALNDKWISGGDYTTKTLFEDILFLDRASRNIGDTVILDIFDLKNMFSENSLNMAMDVYTFISGILIKNNFVVMNLPSYINFYNVQDVDGTTIPQTEGTLELANNMWGTFLNVDYRKSSPKMVCFFVGKPSEYLDLPKGNFRFRDDAFNMSRASENPLIENQKDKKDWASSNKCVGFNVDIGTRNQNVFSSFQVSQDNGVATSETINTYLNLVNQANGRNTATQNVSLYNLYTQRSYKCDVVSFGNAMIQPTMYFNLRHVPMFNGPYMITNVEHNISSGNFITKFSGIRQGIYDLPAIDNFLQSLNQNLLTRLQELLKIEKTKDVVIVTTDNNKIEQVTQESENKIDASNSCVNNIDLQAYPDYVVTSALETPLSPNEFAKLINETVPGQFDLALLIWCICYVKSFVENGNSGNGNFIGYNNNFAAVSLYNNFYSTKTYFTKTYCCINIKASTSVTRSEPIVSFDSTKRFIEFMAARLKENVKRAIEEYGISVYYACFWPRENFSASEYISNRERFRTLETNITKAINLANDSKLINQTKAEESINKIIGVIVEATIKAAENSQIPIITNGQACPPPIIDSFAPLQGNTGTIIQINGSGFENVTGVTINGTIVDMKNVTIFNKTTMRVSVPQIGTGTQVVSGQIVLGSQFGNSISRIQTQFTYNPNISASNASSAGSIQNNATTVGSTTNTNPQANGGLTMLSTYTPNETNPQSLNVKINPQINNWVINPEVQINYVIYEVSIQNNELIQETISIDSKKIISSIINNEFNITKEFILNNILMGYTPIPNKSIIETVIIVKASGTSNPVEQQFKFNII